MSETMTKFNKLTDCVICHEYVEPYTGAYTKDGFLVHKARRAGMKDCYSELLGLIETDGLEERGQMITKITKAYVRTYSDNGQTKAYVEWVDRKGESGRTEGELGNAHMQALLQRAEREGITVERQRW